MDSSQTRARHAIAAWIALFGVGPLLLLASAAPPWYLFLACLPVTVAGLLIAHGLWRGARRGYQLAGVALVIQLAALLGTLVALALGGALHPAAGSVLCGALMVSGFCLRRVTRWRHQ